MSKDIQHVNLSWDTIHDAIECLGHQVKSLNPDLLVAISRGGLIPCTMLSHLLGIPMRIITAQSYEGTRRTLDKPTEIVGWDRDYDNIDSRVCFIDDILDSGHTFEAVKNLYNQNPGMIQRTPNYCTLVNKQPYTYKLPYFIHVPKDVWVQFPWEK